MTASKASRNITAACSRLPSPRHKETGLEFACAFGLVWFGVTMTLALIVAVMESLLCFRSLLRRRAGGGPGVLVQQVEV